MKDIRRLFITSPLTLLHILVTLALIPYAYLEAEEQFGTPYCYIFSVVQSMLLYMSILAMIRTFTTHPGEVSKLIIDKLKHQLCTEAQLKKMDEILDLKTRRHYLLKCFNRAMVRHIQMTHEQAPSQFQVAMHNDDVELLNSEKQPKKGSIAYEMYAEDARQVPQICRFRFCQPCGQILPPRCEHCNKASCDTCIMKIDHHCKFMGNNCIGFLNHKFFILYLLYLQMGLQLTCLPFWHQILWHKRGFFELLDESIPRTVAALIAFCVSLFLMMLFIVQMHMLRMNMTMYELTLSRSLKPFRHKLWVKNWQTVFGRRKRDWFNPWVHPFTEDPGTQANEFISSIIPTMRFQF